MPKVRAVPPMALWCVLMTVPAAVRVFARVAMVALMGDMVPRAAEGMQVDCCMVVLFFV